MISAENLAGISGISHGFFTRENGVSQGIYESLNTGFGSHDKPENVIENRHRIAHKLGISDDALLTVYQWHSADVITATKPWDIRQPPKGDAIVSTIPGQAIAILTADCTPVLFASDDGQIIGAAHAGWKGAIGGVLSATYTAMIKAGAQPGSIHAAIGPTIHQQNYEVGPEFVERFCADDESVRKFFINSPKPDHALFDLPGFVRHHLTKLDLASIHDVDLCTYADSKRFFSYRRTTHKSEPDYGRQLSAIAIS